MNHTEIELLKNNISTFRYEFLNLSVIKFSYFLTLVPIYRQHNLRGDAD